MEKLKNWNDLSEKLLSEIPKLKTNQAVKFVFLNGAENTHPDHAERMKQPFIFPKENIVLKDKIWDPYTNAGKGAWVNIGIWKELDKDGNPMSFISFLPWAYGRTPYDGVFHLIGGRDNDDEYFEFLFLSNKRKDNPNARNGGNQPLFEMVDLTKESVRSTKKATTLRQALQAVEDMNLREKKEFAASMLWASSEWDEEMLDGKLNEFAMTQSDLFIKNYGNPDLKTRATVGQAAQMDVIRWDGKRKVSYGQSGVLISQIEVEEGKTWMDAFCSWIKSHKDGSKALANIKTQLKNLTPVAEESGQE